MPVAIPLALGAAAAGAGVAGGIAAGAASLTFLGIGAWGWAAISVGLTVLGSVAQMMLSPTPPKPQMQDGDVSVKQAIPSRRRIYGRQRTGGVFLYYDSTSEGDLKTLICHAAHEIDDSIIGAPNPEEHWLNDERVQINASGQVTDDPWWQEGSGLGDDEGHSVVTIIPYLGKPDQVIAEFDDRWTADHKGHGLNCTYVEYNDLKDEDQLKVFPQGPPPYRVVLRGAKVFDPRDSGQTAGAEAGYKWSDNAALVVLDFLTRTENGIPVGFGIAWSRVDTASFAAAAAICDQLIPKRVNGVVDGVEKRWRSWGAYELSEDRKDVLKDLLDACAGRLIQTPQGKIGLSVGAGRYRILPTDAWITPSGVPASTVTLGEDQLFGWDLTNGKAAIERVNEVRATYVAEAWDWAETEAGIQTDDAGIERNGTESSQIKLRFVPSESQAQRVAREVLRRGNPTWIGTVRTTLAGLDAWGERWITLQIPELLIDGLFEVTGMRLDRTTMMVEIDVSSYDDWWDWTASVDEKLPAIPPPEDEDEDDIPIPDEVAVTIVHRPINGQTVQAVGVITWDPPPRPIYTARARYRPVTVPPSPWQSLPVAQDGLQVETNPLADGQGYEAQVRFLGARGAGGDFSPPVPFTAIADPVAPPSPTGLTAQQGVPALGSVTVQATAPNSPKHASLRFYRNSSSSFAGATLIAGPLYSSPGSTRSYVDTPGTGDWWYFATSANWSNIESLPTLPGVLAEVLPPAPVITTTPATIGQTNPTIAGTSVAGATIKVFANAVLNTTTTANGSGNWSVPLIALGGGAQAITATATVAGNESAASGSVTLIVVWYDPDASVHADFKGGQYRLNGSASTLAGIFDVLTTSAQIVTHANGSMSFVPANSAPLCDRGLEVWENRTNRCTNRNAAPVDLTGVTLSGDAAATLTRVDDSASMGSGSILNALLTGGALNGFVYKLDNSLGTTDAFATISGTVAVVGACRGSIVYRGSAGRIEIGGATAVAFAASTSYARVGGGRTAAATTEQMRVAAPAGSIIFFILNQLENGAMDTAPIVVNAATASRNAPLIQHTAGIDFNAVEGFFGARAKVALGTTNSGIVVGSLQTTIADANLIQFSAVSAMRGLTQVAAAATGLASQSVTATNMTTGVYGYRANDFAFSANGLPVVTDTSGAVPTGTPVKITVSLSVTPPLNGVIEQVKWGIAKPSNAVIQAKSGWTTLS
jgi:hypothetical protein